MKNFIYFLMLNFVFFHASFAQDEALAKHREGVEYDGDLPIVNMKTLEGEAMLSDQLDNEGKPMMIVFWDIPSKASRELLPIIQENYKELQEKNELKVIAISCDSKAIFASEKAAKNRKGITDALSYENYWDSEGDLIYGFGVGVHAFPTIFLLDGDKKVIAKIIDINHINLEGKQVYENIKKMLDKL